MNKTYLMSLGGYLVVNTIFYVMLSAIISNPITLMGFLITTAIAIPIHKSFVWKG